MEMTNTAEGSVHAVLDAKEFLREHGGSLSGLLRAVAGASGRNLTLEVGQALGEEHVDPQRAGHVLRAIRNLLLASEIPRGVCPDSFRWHGARVSDLAVRFP